MLEHAVAVQTPAVTVNAVSPPTSNRSETQYPSSLMSRNTNDHDRRSASTTLDQQIKAMRLSSVVPLSFHYAALLPSYGCEKPYLSRLPCLTGLKRTNIAASKHGVQIFDLSGHEAAFRLDESGFEFAKSPIIMAEWTTSSVLEQYLPSMREWVKEHIRCADAFVYAYNVRAIQDAFRAVLRPLLK